MVTQLFTPFFSLDALGLLMMALVVFIGVCVGSFASRYLKGDAQYRSFFVRLCLLVVSVSVMVSADHLAVLFAAWCFSNSVLVRLMIHKAGWKAAKASGMLAATHYLFGAACVGGALLMFYAATGHVSLHALLSQPIESPLILPALGLLLIGAMTQSAIWPFHRWLTSSLNSPTPVSAIMHAGLVNGGGFLLVRFAPLYLEFPVLLTAIFVIGMVTALLGTCWKLMQSDVKRMLACSTMGQMGFMVAQCGLGLFPAAVAHLIWHGMFKAYLFLASGAAAQEKRLDLGYPPSLRVFLCALLCGVLGSLGFGFASEKSWLAGDTTLVLMVVAFISGTQFALAMLRCQPLRGLPLALMGTMLMGLAYGGSVRLIAWAMEPMQLMQPQVLNGAHAVGMMAMLLAWAAILFLRHDRIQNTYAAWMQRFYVVALNASQPHPATITAHRNHYQR